MPRARVDHGDLLRIPRRRLDFPRNGGSYLYLMRLPHASLPYFTMFNSPSGVTGMRVRDARKSKSGALKSGAGLGTPQIGQERRGAGSGVARQSRWVNDWLMG